MAKTPKRRDGRKEKKVTINGVRYSVYGRTEQELMENILRKREELEEAAFKPGKELTLDEYVIRFIDNRRDTVKSTTVRSYKMKLKKLCECKVGPGAPKLGKLKLAAIEADHIRAVQRKLKKDGLNSNSINGMVVILKTVFKEAMYDRLLKYNPVDGVRPLRKDSERATDTIHRALTETETKRFFEVARKESRYYELYRFLINTGCRVGEAGALKYDDVKDGFIVINKTITRNGDGENVIGDTTKTKAGERRIPMTPVAKEALDNQKRYNFESQGAEAFKKERVFFWNARGGYIDAAHVGQDVKRMCRLCGVEKFTPHAFRDTFATRCIESGMTMKTLQEILGHSDISMTMNLYAHCMEETKVKEMANVNIAL